MNVVVELDAGIIQFERQKLRLLMDAFLCVVDIYFLA